MSFLRSTDFDISGEELPEGLDAPDVDAPDLSPEDVAPASPPRFPLIALVAALIAGAGLGVIATRLGAPEGDDPTPIARARSADKGSSVAVVERAATSPTRTTRPKRPDRPAKRRPPARRRPASPPPAVHQRDVSVVSAPAPPPPPTAQPPAPPVAAPSEFGIEP